MIQITTNGRGIRFREREGFFQDCITRVRNNPDCLLSAMFNELITWKVNKDYLALAKYIYITTILDRSNDT